MTIWWLLVLLFVAIIILGIGILFSRKYWDLSVFPLSIGIVGVIIMLFIAILQPIDLKREQIRQDKEREQIIYQISILNEIEENKAQDTIKLNEKILEYNDWINDINTSKESFGWCSWYRDFDMSKHQIIELK